MQEQLSDGPGAPDPEAVTPENATGDALATGDIAVSGAAHDPSTAPAPTGGAAGASASAAASTDVLRDLGFDDDPAPRRRRRVQRTDWRLGGTAVRRWDAIVLAIALISLGIGAFGSALISSIWTSPWSGLVSTTALWVGMLFAVVYAFSRGRPAGLLKLRPVDLLFGVMLGLLLRLLQGWVTDAGHQPLPSIATLDGSIPPTWFLTEALPGGLIAPVVEEFFFRTVLLVVVYTLLRRPAGRFAAALAAVLVSTATFILMHAVDGSLPLAEALPLGALGLTCALLVMLTGRIWSAVIVHIVYNTTMLVIVAAGTILR
ncbi:lysostaphin resistance A-like protein [Microbacterium sp. 179-B 1A2 NHS]|uniref:CPBP family intramembrane glutamic endopeptidase n=1 Tax=Microbacterium sp. 179-B 1A2 NHS TaxID=3142383 RepID=UPI0039A03E79